MRLLHRLACGIAAATGLALAFAGTASAQVTYTVSWPNYNVITNAGACTVGHCGVAYTTAMHASGQIVFSGPFAPNQVNIDVGPMIIGYIVTDGQNTYRSSDATSRIYVATLSTDGTGSPFNYNIVFESTPGPPYNINNAADPNSRFSYLQITPTGNFLRNNAICTARGGLSAASAAGTCGGEAVDGGTSTAQSPVGDNVSVAAGVPTLSEWALMALGLGLAALGFLAIRRRSAGPA